MGIVKSNSTVVGWAVSGGERRSWVVYPVSLAMGVRFPAVTFPNGKGEKRMRTSVVYDRETDMLLITFYVCDEETDTLRMYPVDFAELREQVDTALDAEDEIFGGEK